MNKFTRFIDDYPFTVYRIDSHESELKRKMFLEAI